MEDTKNQAAEPANYDPIEKSWDEFRKSGLVLIINQLLHVFGWAITFAVEDGKVINCYPARVKYRGFDNDTVDANYLNVAKYMKEHAAELLEEAEL